MEIHTGLFGVTRPPSESLPEKGKLLRSESELEPNLVPQSKLELPQSKSEPPKSELPQSKSEPPKLELPQSKSEPQSKLELEPKLESESPPPKLELEPKLESESPQPKLELEPKLESESKSEPESESKSEPEWYHVLNSKQLRALKTSDFSMYDDDPKPFMFSCRRFVYKNKAQIIKDQQIKVAMDDYRERSRNLSVFDAISRPEILDTVGGGPVPLHITEDVRLRLTPLCKLALDKYNVDKDTHFVFAKIVKSTSSPAAMYYITFLAQDSSNNNISLTTFQAQVSNRKPGPKVYSCAIKT